MPIAAQPQAFANTSGSGGNSNGSTDTCPSRKASDPLTIPMARASRTLAWSSLMAVSRPAISSLYADSLRKNHVAIRGGGYLEPLLLGLGALLGQVGELRV